MDRPKMAVLDGDIIAYRASFWAESEGIDWLEPRIRDDITKWTPFGCDKVVVALSCNRRDNFRRNWWPEYKAHRDTGAVRKPDGLGYALEFIQKEFYTWTVDTLEADDLMGVAASKGKGIAVTVDKDLRSVPGWHWNPDKEPEGPTSISTEEADRQFHIQWLTGDTTDNFKSLYRMGPKKAEKILDSTLPQNWGAAVMATFERWPLRGPYNRDFAEAMGVCARILRHTDVNLGTLEINLGWLP